MNILKNYLYIVEYDAKNNDSSGIRMWQRLTKLTSVKLDFGLSCILRQIKFTPYQLLLDKIATLKNIRKLEGEILEDHLPIHQILIKNCKENITHYGITIEFFDLNLRENLSPLPLPNARHISVRCSNFYIIWFDKCEKLNLTK